TKMQQVVLEIARGKEWDRDCVAMISAILNIPHFVPLESARETLLLGSRHVNPIVRDAVATAIQVYAGVPKQEILWGTGSGTLMSIINTSIAKLLDPKGD
ncbi:MAG: hypothetical protein U1C74_06130, partial [Phenylobacterium sp.]|nr:hypothetical protein [Phenylobacterium sp.]